MPRMDLKQESRLNGVKTNIFNLEDVAKALRVPGEFIIKYMCAELGVAKEKKSIIKGKHSFDDLQQVLDAFIAKYLLCQKCNLPETSLFEEKKLLKAACRACGKVSKLDNGHKITGYILKNIPKGMSEMEGAVKVEEEKDEGKTKTKGKKIKKTKEDKKDEEEEEESSLNSKKKKKEEEEKLGKDSEEVAQVIETLKEYVKEKADSINIQDLQQEIRNQCVSIGATPDLKYYIAFNSIFTANILKEFEKFKELFKSYLQSDGVDGPKHFIMTIVDFFITKYPKLEVAIPTFLMNVYNADLIDEEVLLKWEAKKFKTDKKSSMYDKKKEKKFKKAGEKFFTWLKEAEEAESEEDEEEDEEEQKKELTEEQLKAKKMKELIEKEKQQQEKELAESKLKQEQERKEKSEKEELEGKIDVLKVDVDEDEEELDIDNI